MPRMVKKLEEAIVDGTQSVGDIHYNWLERVRIAELNMRDLQLYAQDVIKTANVVFSRCCFAEDSTELFISACRTCSTLLFPH